MRPIERFLVLGGVAAAILISLSGRTGDNRALATLENRAAATKFGVVDVFVIAEGMMEASELKRVRTDAYASWQAKAEAILKDLQELDTELSILPQNDPKAQEVIKRAQVKQQDYQKVIADRTADLERINSSQLIEAYSKIRTAVETVAQREGYSHVFANREYTRKITTTTMSQTLQELLARPIVNAGQVDDLTKAVMAELKIGTR
jgi:Skp family chaperone for outer membrane proteins